MLPALDLSSVLQLAIALLLTLSGALLLLKRTASRFFVVDASFEAGSSPSGYEPKVGMSRGGRGEGGGSGDCSCCGKQGTKKCSRCKRVQYCSIACQTKHWKTLHMFECKKLKLSESEDKADIVLSGNGSCRRRKSSGLSSISLVPARGTYNILQKPKKILFPYNEFVRLFNWENPGFPPCGLLNCGNSCFANVVLQCLACTRPLIAYLLERDHIRECVRKHNDWCFLCELQVHIKRASESSDPFSPLNILSRLPNIGGNLGYGRQEDAHEFMRFAIDTMQSVCLDEFGGEKMLDPSTQETTLIHYIFGGYLQSQVTCTKCNTISNRYENMMDLTVEIHGDAESLEECLDQFTMKEWLDGDNKYKCDGCNDYVKAWKRLTVHQPPNILTITLKRFQSGRFGKLNKRVTFPENLNLTPYMSGSSDGTDLYVLYAVVVHVDMLNASFFGHYICYTKDYQGKWYRIDDSKVTDVEVEDALAEGAYMLLYRRTTVRKEPFVKHAEPQKTKQLIETHPKVVDHSYASCNGSDKDSQPSSSSVVLTEANEVEVMVLDSRENGLEGCSPDLFPSRPDRSSVEAMQLDHHPATSSTEADADTCEIPDARNDAGCHVVGDSESTGESSISPDNDAMIIESSSNIPITAEIVVSRPSCGSFAESDHPLQTYNSLDSSIEVDNVDATSVGNEGNKAMPLIWENNSSGKINTVYLGEQSLASEEDKPKHIHSVANVCEENKENGHPNGGFPNTEFLDQDSVEKNKNVTCNMSLVSGGLLEKSNAKSSEMNTASEAGEQNPGNHVAVSGSKGNGHSNGYHRTVVSEQGSMDKSKIASNDISFMPRGFLQKSYTKNSGKNRLRGSKKFAHPQEAECNGSNGHVCGSTIAETEFRPEAPCSNGSSLTHTNGSISPSSTFGENGNGKCKDGPLISMTSRNNEKLSASVSEHKKLNKLAICDANITRSADEFSNNIK
ncbi:ubiquitin carboxyl-terminal hydrolase 18-like [Zingiber officinale]|uniref:ubiquitin carboxyl-terminal hydrolase 18-like n=1 Tax=Zingiber officinale TaxID=94328 RepID=UPI001C4D6780|nr:ubiquitin carboxyl-terminal hydrolase 18-like [Zingiber officinale]